MAVHDGHPTPGHRTLAEEPLEATVDLAICPRCNADGHEGVVFRAFDYPSLCPGDGGQWVVTHWATCPTNGQPIMYMKRRDDLRGH